jgi:hypothetical protein
MSVPLGMWRKHRDSIFASIGCKDEFAHLRHKRACHRCESRHRFNILIARDVDYVDSIVAGMRNVETVGWRVNVGMVETAHAAMCRQVDITE